MELTPERVKQINKLLWEEKYIIYNPIKGKGFCNINKNKRFKSWIFKGSGSKNLLKQFLAYNPEYKCIAQIQDKNGYRQFIPFKSWESCWDVYKTAGYYKRYLYEVIVSNNYCKPYLDIEWKPETDIGDEDVSGFVDQLQQDLICIFDKRYHIELKKEHILICQAHCSTKVSFHVIINCIVDNVYCVYDTNRKKEDNSAWDLYNALVQHNEDYKNKIDESVYSLDREFRAIYSTKYDQIRQFVPYPDCKKKICNNYLDYFITHFDGKYNFTTIKTPEYIHPKKNVIFKATKINEIKGNHVADSIDLDNNHKIILDRINELLQFVHPTAFFTGMTSDRNGWRFSYSDKSEVCYTGHTHKNNGFAVFIKSTDANVYMYCYSTKCGKLYKLGNLHLDTLWKQESIHINQQYLNYVTDIKLDNLLEQEDTKLSGLINNFVHNKGCFAIKSSMGTGKTQLLKKIIEKNFSNQRILYLSHRQTFTQNIYGTFKDLGFYNYLDGISEISTHDKIILQIDSLKHLFNIQNKIQIFDFIILDEIESLLAHLSSPTLADKRHVVCLILEQLLTKAKWVICMDADFNTRSYEFLTKIGKKPTIIINDFRTVRKKFMFDNRYEIRYYQLLEDIKNKKNICIICLSKNTLDDIYERIIKALPKVNIIRYTSMTDDEQKTALNNVNAEWIKYQVVMYSPTIESGLDFNKEHFNKIYCFLSSGSCSPRSFIQMVGRIRTITDHKIRCVYDNHMLFDNKKVYIPSIDEFEELIISKLSNIQNFNFVSTGENEIELVRKKDAFTRVFAHNYLENYEKQIHFMSVLKEMIVEKEWDYVNENAGESIDTETDPDPDLVEQKSNIQTLDSTHENTELEINIYEGLEKTSYGSSGKTIELDEILDSPLLTKEEADKLESKKCRNQLTRNDKMALRKYWIIKKFKIDPEELNMEFLLNWYGKEYILDNVMYAMGKKKIKKNDPYLNTMKQKIEYVKKILTVYGFDNLFDFETVAEKDGEMEQRMKDSKLLDWDTYTKMMNCFGKRMYRNKEKNTFSVSSFVILSNSIFYEFGVGIISTKKRIRKNGTLAYKFLYSLTVNRSGLKNLIS